MRVLFSIMEWNFIRRDFNLKMRNIIKKSLKNWNSTKKFCNKNKSMTIGFEKKKYFQLFIQWKYWEIIILYPEKPKPFRAIMPGFSWKSLLNFSSNLLTHEYFTHGFMFVESLIRIKWLSDIAWYRWKLIFTLRAT